MTWLAWRQHRASILAAGAGLAALAAFLLVTGTAMRQRFDRLGLNDCAAPFTATCAEAGRQFEQQYSGYQVMIPLLLILPALVGVFWGAPLVSREVEHGTHRLVWTQSITRRRWLGTKLALLGAAALTGLAVATVVLTWWVAPLMAARDQRFEAGIFDLLGVVPAAYGIAALAIGLAAGTFSRRLVAALGITLVAFVILRVGVEFGLRPHYMAPVTVSTPFATDTSRLQLPTMPDDIGWVISQQTLDSAGRVISDGVGFEFGALLAECPELPNASRGQPPDPRATMACAVRNGFHVVTVYQPDDRYWRFQATEAAIYLAVAGALVGTSAWWLRHRIS
jgi:hypothetical protein